MAQNDPSLTPPVASKFTELWYASTEDTSLKQVFGVQSIPTVISASEDITYRTLESDTEFSVPGEQYDALKALESAGTIPWWYVKLPDSSAGTSGKPTVIKWRGALSVALSEIALDDMIRSTLTIGKSTVPETIEGLPSEG